ncbi:MAG TPA: chromosomal replication initiator protein DnaA [Bacteroidales bacterium]|nr:chromosomal replication initiator protein DnaA [Bacteroidales bacterium]HPR59089.1 chromosomal replication initiator protein DnaA [Bacteroidales bacterium]HRW96613.1 chromosomal replication initiator protein DnaA [Bacteroidales bacterium]
METLAVKVWDNCLKIIKDNINHQSFRTWFEPIKPVKLHDNVLTIQVPSQFFYEWLEEHYITLLKRTIKKELGATGRLEYSILIENANNYNDPYSIVMPTSNLSATRNPDVAVPLSLKTNSKVIPDPFVIPGIQKVKINSQLVERYSFDNFIEGDCNRLARSAGLAIAKNPGKTAFNPLFIYSKVGLGKSHLAHAIGLEVKNNFPDKTVLYVSSDQFMAQYIESVRNNNQNDFTNFYQLIDVLIVDDIHFLTGKEKTQDVFFHIFNQLHQRSKQLVITSDRPPVEIEGIEPRLLSRFKWGLTADLQPPDLETRIAILQKRLYNDGITMPDNVIEYLAYSITTNIRELEGAMISLLAQASLNKKEINLDLARQIVESFIRHSNKEISIDFIQKVVSQYFGLSIDEMNSKTRKRNIVQARQLAMYFSKEHTKASLTTIGLQCGNKDHATVLHSCRTVKNLIETDKDFKNYVEELDRLIKL